MARSPCVDPVAADVVVLGEAVPVAVAEALRGAAVVVVADAEVRAAAAGRRVVPGRESRESRSELKCEVAALRRDSRDSRPGTTQRSATPSTAAWSSCSRREPFVSQCRIP